MIPIGHLKHDITYLILCDVTFVNIFFQFHPDKNKDVRAQEKFVRIVEAYNVLGKPTSRAHYDNMIEIETTGSSYVYRSHVAHK